MTSLSSTMNSKQIKLNVIDKNNHKLRASIIVGNNLTISHLKRKIQSEFNELYSIEIVVKLILDKDGFIISNNSAVDQHFTSADTIYFQSYPEQQKRGSNMQLVSNFGQILSTVRFVTASALEKFDKVDLNQANVMEIVSQLLHIGFWYNNEIAVQKLYKVFNKIFSPATIQQFLSESSQIQKSLFLKNFTFWIIDSPKPVSSVPQITWQLIQLLQKFSLSQKFTQIIKNHKLTKSILQLSKDMSASSEVKKICIRIIKNINTGGRGMGSHGMNKIKSQYIPSMLGSSDVNGFGLEDILTTLVTGSPDEKLGTLQPLSQNNFELVQETSIRSDYYQKFMYIFTIRNIKTKKHIATFNQIISKLIANTNKDHCLEIVQKDIFKKIHTFMLEGPVQCQSICLEYLSKICKVSAGHGMFNLEKSLEFFKSPYPQFVSIMIKSVLTMSQNLGTVSPIRFIPGIRDYITLSLKSSSDQVSTDLLKIISNLSLDEQCRYQILNLKGIQVFVKFLEQYSKTNNEICRVAAKGLLNLAISSRENKAKVLSALTTVLQKFYKMQYDSIAQGYIETILKAKNF